MKYSIAFFDVEPQEKDYLIRVLGSENIQYFEESLQDVPFEKYQNTEILSPFIYSQINAEILDKLPNLKLIATRSTGFDHIDIAHAKTKNVFVSNVPVYGENTVAEHTFALILALSRMIPQSVARTQRGDFTLDGLQGFDLKDKTIAVIGTGSIGENVIRIAAGFQMKIVAYSRTVKQELVERYAVRFVDFDEALRTADILTLHVPDNAQTHHMINAENIVKIKRGAMLINTSRGGLVETYALVKALDEGILASAGLDVLEEEELVREERELLTKTFKQADIMTALQNHFLLSRPNVLVTPHNAFNSREAVERIMDITAQNILSFAEGETINIVG